MDLAEIKGWIAETEGKGGIGRRDMMKWLIGEVERLTRRAEIWKGQATKYQEAEQWQKELKEKAESSLTLSRAEGRREGLEAAAKIADRSARMSRTTSKAYAPETQGRNIFESRERLAFDIAAAIREAAQEGKE